MTLSGFTLGIGVVHLLAGMVLAVAPAVAREGLIRFPRNVWIGRVLAALDLAWSVALVWEMPLGWFDGYKVWLWAAGPLAYLLVVVYLDELLAARALGGLWLLLAAPLLDVARFHESTWRLVPVVLAYLWVIMGMALVLAPYRFRQWVNRLCSDDVRCRCLGGVFIMLGGLFVVLSRVEFSG